MKMNKVDISIENVIVKDEQLEKVYQILKRLNLKENEYDVLKKIINYLPDSFRLSNICSAEIQLNGKKWRSSPFEKSACKLVSNMHLNKGKIEVYYSKTSSNEKIDFLPGEKQMLSLITFCIDYYLSLKENTFTRKTTIPIENDSLWRLNKARYIAKKCPAKDLGIIAVYIIGSVKAGTAGPKSDIDLLIHYRDNNVKNKSLIENYFLGWDHSLTFENYRRTGINLDSLIEIHLITDEDIKKKTSYAVMIGSLENSAMLLRKESDE